MKKKEIIKFIIFRTVGNFLVLFMLFGFIATFGPAVYYEVLYQYGTSRGIEFAVGEQVNAVDTTPGQFPKTQEDISSGQGLLSAITSGQKKHVLVPKSAEFSIVIPKIGASEIIQENVDPSNPEDYLKALMKAVAHAKGTAFPGMNGTTYLFAHSADNFWNVGRYNAVFYLLKELNEGDEVVVFFQGARYDYVVNDKKIVEGNDTHYIDSKIGQGEQLILQTCWPPGTTWKRLLIFAKLKGQ